MKNNIESIIKYLKGSNDDFIVTSHISPDGDNIGSTLSMYYALNKLGKNVYYVLDDNPPQNLKFLVENMNILKSEEVNLDSYNIVALDCGDKNRICISQNLIDNAKKIICIDHHASNDYYGDFNYIDTEASSTCELVYNLLVECEKNENININLYLGNEAYISENYIDLIKQHEIMTINNTRYLLLEFPLGNMFRNTKEILYELIVAGCVPILAHPERYKIFQRHPDYIEEYLRMGVLLQGNYKSLFGKYGSDAKKTLKYFLKRGWITFLGSDTHHEEDFDIKKLERKLKSIVKDQEIVEDLLENNFDKVINDLDIGIRR